VTKGPKKKGYPSLENSKTLRRRLDSPVSILFWKENNLLTKD
jgi:hypothetical protein